MEIQPMFCQWLSGRALRIRFMPGFLAVALAAATMSLNTEIEGPRRAVGLVFCT
jgi:hypothetical protein